ncbi:MAG: sigma-70 family RNA polymerase sigma factor [Polyangiales bacterium]
MNSEDLQHLVRAAAAGNTAAYGELIAVTQAMAFSVAQRVLHQRDDALDATQEAYLRAYRGLARLSEPAAFPGYLRRTVLAAAHDLRRARRSTFVLDAASAVPVLDEHEQRWSEAQHAVLARALLRLGREERRITERFYLGGWSLARLAEDAGVSEPTMRKRLQRTRDKLREESETMERTNEALPDNLPARVTELLARPIMVDLPESPIGQVAAAVQAHFAEYEAREVSELVDLEAARQRLGHNPVYVPEQTLFHADATRILRYDLSLPLMLESAGRGAPLRLLTSGKVYRNEPETATHLPAFHQLELLSLDVHNDAWAFIARVLALLDALIPGAPQRVERTEYPFCTRAWDIGVEVGGEYVELLGCGVYQPAIVTLLGGDPAQHVGLGLGIGLERLASLHFGVPDIRKLSV